MALKQKNIKFDRRYESLMEAVTSEVRVEVGGPLRDAHINPKAQYLDYFAKAWAPEKTQKKK